MPECMNSTSAAAVFESPEAESPAGCLTAGECGAPRVARTAGLCDIEVLTLVARGLTDRALGRQAGHVGGRWVKTHLVRVFAKLGVTTAPRPLPRP
jgi:hypothetical protein